MTLQRILEDEIMDSDAAALDYDSMDHAEVNRAFVDDLIEFATSVDKPLADVLDIGTGTAQIPLILCELELDCRIIATDMAASMLDQAVYNMAVSDVSNLSSRLQLAQADAKALQFTDGMFDTVMSNTILHHLPEPAIGIAEAIRVCKPDGIFFFRDLLRPETEDEVTQLVETYASSQNESQRKLFDDSLRAALTLEEIRSLIAGMGFAPETVNQTSDRHWTWAATNAQ